MLNILLRNQEPYLSGRSKSRILLYRGRSCTKFHVAYNYAEEISTPIFSRSCSLIQRARVLRLFQMRAKEPVPRCRCNFLGIGLGGRQQTLEIDRVPLTIISVTVVKQCVCLLRAFRELFQVRG
jgi:hypothetical protein